MKIRKLTSIFFLFLSVSIYSQSENKDSMNNLKARNEKAKPLSKIDSVDCHQNKSNSSSILNCSGQNWNKTEIKDSSGKTSRFEFYKEYDQTGNCGYHIYTYTDSIGTYIQLDNSYKPFIIGEIKKDTNGFSVFYSYIIENFIVVESPIKIKGTKSGRWVTYHKNGVVASETFFNNDKKTGIWLFYNNKGETILERIYLNDILIKEKTNLNINIQIR